jgi:hypothetical protein
MSIKDWFKRTPAAPRFVEVGKATVTILLDGGAIIEKAAMEIVGEYRFTMDHHDYVTTARETFYSWQERSKKTGMVWVGGGRYVAASRVHEVQVEHKPHQVEAK